MLSHNNISTRYAANLQTAQTPDSVIAQLADGQNEIEERIVEWEPMRKFGVEFKRTSLPIAQAHADFLFEPLGTDQTWIKMQCSFTQRGLLLRLMKPAMKRKMQRGFEQLLLSNKRFLEAD